MLAENGKFSAALKMLESSQVILAKYSRDNVTRFLIKQFQVSLLIIGMKNIIGYFTVDFVF